MSEKVYVVTSGEYSDRSIDRVFKSKELAEKYCKIKNIVGTWRPYEFEEIPISTEIDFNFNNTVFAITFYVCSNGNIGSFRLFEPENEYKTTNCVEIEKDYKMDILGITIYKEIDVFNSDRKTFEKKTNKMLQDLSIELKYHLLDVSEDEHERRINIIEEYLKAKFNIGTDENVLDYDSINKE